MNPFTNLGGQPAKTPPVIKNLIMWTAIIAIATAIIQGGFDQLGVFPGPEALLSLSWMGLQQGYMWQPLTYLFMLDRQDGLTFSSTLSLGFNMYLIWFIAGSLYETVGKWPLLRLYFISGALAGLVAIAVAHAAGQHVFLGGIGASMAALLMVWCMAFSTAEIFLFFLLPIKAKFLFSMILGAFFLTSLMAGDVASMLLYPVGALIGYIYAAMGWGWHTPFAFTEPLDQQLATWGLALRRRLKVISKAAPKDAQGKEKIIKLQPEPEIGDDAFVDLMLAKISKFGERSLSKAEHRRMQEISDRKARKP
jgi:membrane associated rhomboid family serine protease